MSEPDDHATRRVPLEFDDKGNPMYRSVLSPEGFKQRALCIVPPIHTIPIIFVPGIMGSNLRDIKTKYPAWRPPNGVGNGLHEVIVRAGQKPVERQVQLDPLTTEVDSEGMIAVPNSHYTITKEGARVRGWGEVHWEGYGNILLELERALNDQYEDPGTKRAQEMPIWRLAQSITKDTLHHWNPKGDCPSLSADQFLRMDDYFYPVWACGYNWLQSNEISAQTLIKRIDEVISWYQNSKYFVLEGRVILVTHSMGGLVARRAAQQVPDKILGIVHGEQPVLGAPVVYRRFRAGTESDGFFDLVGKLAAIVLGWDAADVTCVLANSAGALELLPTKDYPKEWLKVKNSDGQIVATLPKEDPYSEIYGKRVQDVWWGMIDETLIDPAGNVQGQSAFQAYSNVIESAYEFHDALGLTFHPNTYAHYGADEKQRTFHTVRWQTRHANFSAEAPQIRLDQADDLMKAAATKWDKLGNNTAVTLNSDLVHFQLLGKDGGGDSTVPTPSGAAVENAGLKLTFKNTGFEHAKSYNNRHVLDITAYCIARIVQDATPIEALPKGNQCSPNSPMPSEEPSSSPASQLA